MPPLFIETSMKKQGYAVNRLTVRGRFGLNKAILIQMEVQNGKDILVATEIKYVDSLSESSTGKVMVLVNQSMTVKQISFFRTHAHASVCI